MTTHANKLNEKLDMLAENAKDAVETAAGKIMDTANDVAHATVEAVRQGTENAGGKLIEAGEKITKLAK